MMMVFSMTEKKSISDDDLALFREAISGTKKLNQDKILLSERPNIQQNKQKRGASVERDHSFYFSDQFEPLLNETGATHYARQDISKYEVKKLRRGVYRPEMFLDLHGMTQLDAKRELGALIAACLKENIRCACVIHGIGKHILKQKTPLWLAQHPDILAFHQAPLEFGGNGALLILIDISDR